MANERRDHRRRASTMQQIVMSLFSATTWGVRSEELDLPRRIVERILARLATRGFVRHMGERWIPTPLLLSSANIVLVRVPVG